MRTESLFPSHFVLRIQLPDRSLIQEDKEYEMQVADLAKQALDSFITEYNVNPKKFMCMSTLKSGLLD